MKKIDVQMQKSKSGYCLEYTILVNNIAEIV